MSAKPKSPPKAGISGEAVSLDSIISALRKREPKPQLAQAEAFVRLFYKRMSAEEMVLHSPEGWAALASDFLGMVRARKPGTAVVRIFNSSLKQHGWESPHTVIQIGHDDMPILVDAVTMALAECGDRKSVV